jgi:HEAT repeat protein
MQMDPVDQLVEKLRNPDRYVRLSAVDELANFPDPRSVRALLDTLRDADVNNRYVAFLSLGKIGPIAAGPLVAELCILDSPELMGFTDGPCQAFIEIGSEAVNPLIPLLKHHNDYFREMAAEALGEIGDPRALPELERVAREDSCSLRNVRSAAERAVKKIQARS